MPTLWPHQQYAIAAVRGLIAAGRTRICVTSPTGGGKTRVATELVQGWLEEGRKVVLYTNRRTLLDQLTGQLDAAGLEYGVRAAGHQDRRDRPLQISSVQTELARVTRRAKAKDPRAWEPHAAARVLVDEAHLFTSGESLDLLRRHLEAGAVVVGPTATPLGVGHFYTDLVTAGTPSELRACGALVAAHHFGPDEPDLKVITKTRLAPVDADLTDPQIRKLFPPTQFLLGRVLDWYRKLNPEQKPTILFAPGVDESRWFAQGFTKNGIPAVHIDGDYVWADGQEYESDSAAREGVLNASRAGDVKVICNRYVLREGVDCPWLEHGILATVFGGLGAYLQAGGRLLRASPATGKTKCVIQDHGGNYWRHGSLNADRFWSLSYTADMMAALRADLIREKVEKEPARCPMCARILFSPKCVCGWEGSAARRSRPVVQVDGTLRDLTGEIFAPRRRAFKPDTFTLWQKVYWQAKNSGMTFRQAEGFFAHTHHYYPPRTLPLMPGRPIDWFRKVKDVPKDELNKG